MPQTTSTSLACSGGWGQAQGVERKPETHRRTFVWPKTSLSSKGRLGPRPRNLVSVLAEMALAGPGTSAFRALSPQTESSSEADDALIAAGRIGWAMRGLLDRADAALAIRSVQSRRSRGKLGERTYWRDALRYCCWEGSKE